MVLISWIIKVLVYWLQWQKLTYNPHRQHVEAKNNLDIKMAKVIRIPGKKQLTASFTQLEKRKLFKVKSLIHYTNTWIKMRICVRLGVFCTANKQTNERLEVKPFSRIEAFTSSVSSLKFSPDKAKTSVCIKNASTC